MAREFEEKEYPRDGKSLLFLHLSLFLKFRNEVFVQINWKKYILWIYDDELKNF